MNSQPFTSLDMIYIFVSFLLSIIFVTFIKKIIYRFKHKKRYYIFPKTNIKGIANIAMVISLSVAIIVLLTIITANTAAVLFRAFPGIRITLEGILIKVGGLLFGPFIGIFIGGVTDLLVIAMTAGIFHYGYFLSAILYGLLGGVVREVVRLSSKNEKKFAFFSILSLVLFSILVSLSFVFNSTTWDLPFNQIWESLNEKTLNISFFSIDISINKIILLIIINSVSLCGISLILIFYFICKKTNKKFLHEQFMTLSPVITLVFISELFVNVFFLPVFDAKISTLTYEQWLGIRSLLFTPMVFGNIIVIWPIYKIVFPLVGYDYTSDLSEDLKIPLFYDDIKY